MSKYLSADDLLTGIVGGTKDVNIEGLGTVQVRALEYVELKVIDTEAAGDPMRAGLLIAMRGLESPKLGPDRIAQFEKARPGVIATISKAVSELSGLGDDREKKAGSGS